MTSQDALKILNECATAPKKMEAFAKLAKKVGAPTITVYQWWWNERVPSWRLAAFGKLKKRRAS